MAKFEGYERREAKILAALKEYGINSIDECKEICDAYGIDPYKIVEETQPICFENAKWAYVVGAAIAIKKGCKKASDAAAAIGIGLQAFCIPGSVAENRKVGLGHGNLGAMLLSDETECFCFLAGHESFAAAEGAIKIALNANKVRTKPLRVILNGLGKDAAYIISRINGFTYCQTEFDPYTESVKVVKEIIVDGSFDFVSKGFSTSAYSGDVNYSIDIQVRDGRLKATMSNFRHVRVRSKVNPLGTVYKEDLTKEEYKEGGHGDIFTTRSVYNGVMKSIREQAEKEWNKIKVQINAGLTSSVKKEEADW